MFPHEFVYYKDWTTSEYYYMPTLADSWQIEDDVHVHFIDILGWERNYEVKEDST